MPKVKTRKIARKRFRITKKGKVLHRVQGRRHIRRVKSKSRQRRQDRLKSLATRKHQRKIKEFIG